MVGILLGVIICGESVGAPIVWKERRQGLVEGSTNQWRTTESNVTWEGANTAIVVCDMWDKHWCPEATERVDEMVPHMNRVLQLARQRGALIIHCPSDTMDFYKNHPGYHLAKAAPKFETTVPLKGWCSIEGQKEPPLPIDDSDGGCNGCPDCRSYRAWSRQHAGIAIQAGDAVTDSVDAFYLMKQRNITNVVVLGVHANMCVLGRPFSIRQMVAQGQNVLLMRDMTDSMYNQARKPYVSHFVGTDLVVDHIEKYWCGSVTSSDLTGENSFRFKSDVRKRIAIMTGENEYSTEKTLAEFAGTELRRRGYEVEFVRASEKEGDPEFENFGAIENADVLVVSVRRRAPSSAVMNLVKEHVRKGRAVVGIRTASHAFDTKPKEGGYEAWSTFDEEVLGIKYLGHYSNKPPIAPHTVLNVEADAKVHPVLTGVNVEGVKSSSHLYKYGVAGRGVKVLVNGTVGGQGKVEPVVWIRELDKQRVFYTSMGNIEDFQSTTFRRLFLNGIIWALGESVPAADWAIAPITTAMLNSNSGAKEVGNRVEARTKANAVSAQPKPVTKTQPPPVPLGSGAPVADLPQEANSPALAPEASVAQFDVAHDFVWEQVMAEPVIEQPVFLNFDERGRMWVVEYRQYPLPAGLKLMSRDSVWRNVYDKIPPPPPNHYRGLDRISIHEDKDGDGKFEDHRIFLDGLNIVTSVERGLGGVWVMNPPYLMFYPDANGDDIPDGNPEVRLSGFGLEDTHSVANSIRWGPDGWLYGAQGSTVTAKILVYGNDGVPVNKEPIYSQGQNIWRYHPRRRIYEVFSEGGGNAFGCEIDSEGRIFSGHNGGDTRGFHYMQGAYLQKGFEKHGPLSNPHAYGFFPAMPHHQVARFTHNFVIYDGGSLGPGAKGKLYGIEPLQGRIVESEMERDGTSFKTKDLRHIVTSRDRWFRPVDIKTGPDGALYVCDWYDEQVNHFRNHEGRMSTKNGRIYRLRSSQHLASKAKSLANPLGSASDAELISALASENKWHRQTALRLLGDRAGQSLEKSIRDRYMKNQGTEALHLLWALASMGSIKETDLIYAFNHPKSLVRSWGVRLACDYGLSSELIGRQLGDLSSKESHPEVRIQLAASSKRMPGEYATGVLRGLLQKDEDASDKRIPLMLWWGIESKCEKDSEWVLKLFADRSLWDRPLVRDHILERLSRRYASSGLVKDLMICAKFFEFAPHAEAVGKLSAGVETAYKGRPMTGLPRELIQGMSKYGQGSLSLRMRQGDAEAARMALDRVKDDSVKNDERAQLLAVIGELRIPGASPTLIQVLLRLGSTKEDLRRATMLAMQGYDLPEVAQAILDVYPTAALESKRVAEAVLSSRAGWSKMFLETIKLSQTGLSMTRRIPVKSIPVGIVQRVKQYKQSDLKTLAEELWPTPSREDSVATEARISEVSKWVRSSTGDPYAGRTLYQNICASCHKLFGQGAEVGPELTTFKRDDLESMVLAIVNPGAEIREGYENYSIETRDGRSLSGFLVEQTKDTIVLRGLDGHNTLLNRSELTEIRPPGTSLMPEGLLDGLTEEQVRDLFAYLRSTQPLVGSPPVTRKP